ncbi:MAG: hypothetical protein GWO24_17100, partial [Akkermansiaceae bacterium]|nr:hypothetical protein [Akkermansiaceae bacterium]
MNCWLAPWVFGLILLVGCRDSAKDSNHPSPVQNGTAVPASPAVAPVPSEATFDENQWDAEAYQDRTARQLALIADALQRSDDQSSHPEHPGSLLTPEFALTILRPPDEEARIEYDQLDTRVLRWDGARSAQLTPAGAPEFGQALEALRATWPRDTTKPRLKLKQFRIDPQDGEIVSQVSYRAFAKGAETGVQQTGTWSCGWEFVPEGGPLPRLRWLRLDQLEEVQVTVPGGEPLLVDATESLLGELPSYREQLRH